MNNLNTGNESLSFFHLNIVSLNFHKDELEILLENCNTKFNFIGISESEITKRNPLNLPMNIPIMIVSLKVLKEE